MNTDNMSVLGLTLDYGPFGFMDAWDAGHICNHSDHQGRYAFHQQPQIGQWNVVAFLSCLLPYCEEEQLKEAVAVYASTLDETYRKGVEAKLGWQSAHDGDEALIADMFSLFQATHVDHTLFFRRLSSLEARGSVEAVCDLFVDRERAQSWLSRYQARLLQEQNGDKERQKAMKQVNPKYILRNYMAEQAIRQANEHQDFSEVQRLLSLLSRPFDEQPEMEQYAGHPPDWANHISVSCSS